MDKPCPDRLVPRSNTLALRAGAVDFVAGEIALLTGDNSLRREDEQFAMNTAQMADAISETSAALPSAEASGLSAFSRFRLGRDVSLNANTPVSRVPLFQRRDGRRTRSNSGPCSVCTGNGAMSGIFRLGLCVQGGRTSSGNRFLRSIQRKSVNKGY